METHPLVFRIASDLGKLNEDGDWQTYVPAAIQAVRSVADWAQELHRSAKADLDATDCYVTVPFLHGIADGAYAGEH